MSITESAEQTGRTPWPPARGVHTDAGPGVLAFPASMAQQALWYAELLQGEGTVFNVPLRWRLTGPLDVSVLERTLNTIVERHESLRTHLGEAHGELVQIVRPELKLKLEVVDISHLPMGRLDEEAERLGDIEARASFRLATGPLIRAGLVRLGASWHLHITVHQAVFDGLSMAVLTEEIAAIYQACVDGTPCPLEALPLQYGDFSVWQHDFLKSPDMQRQRAWWTKRLDGMAEMDLPTDAPRPAVKSWKGGTTSTLLPRALTDRLEAIAAHHGATLFHLQLAACTLLLHRYTGSTDVAVCTSIAGRHREGLAPLIGLFTNWLVLRNDLSGNPPFGTLLGQVRDTAHEAQDHQDLPFECLVRELRPERDASRRPLFQVGFSHHRPFAEAGAFGGLSFTPIPSPSPGTVFDLHVSMVESAEGWRAACHHSTDLFSGPTADRMLGHFKRLLEDIAAHPSSPIDQLNILTEAERSLLLGDWKGISTGYPQDATIGGLFEETARRFPERVALRSDGLSLTYAQLHAEAGHLALRLRDAGIAPGDLVAVSARRSAEMIVGFLSILLAGGCCVPIDPDYPADRFALQLEDCGASIGLATAGCEASYPTGWQGTLITVPAAGQATALAELPAVSLTADHPAHLLFTSGSTGRPKGVLLRHRGVVRLVRNQNFMAITPDDVFLQAAPASFDASLLEIWGPLLNGGCLVVPADGPGIADIATAVREHGVTTLWLTSGLFQLMMDESPASLKGLRHLLSGGDVLSPAHVRRALETLPDTRLINGYGPTENTTFTSCHTITPADLDKPSIPIGTPIANTTVYLLDGLLRPVPVGVPGELYTGGDGLAIGYHGAPELTAEKFIHHPAFGRLYRTGDLCRRADDGTIAFLGRADHQAKVRGFRIEPGEIETLLASHPSVRQAKVAVRGDSADTKRILAWVTPHEPGQVQETDLTAFLANRLPAFMRPDAIGIVDAFPLNANGKIQVSTLPDPVRGSRPETAAVAAAPPVGETEERLAVIWRELLGRGDIHRGDDFFALGGHSLMALRMFYRINREFGKTLPLATLLQQPTIEGLAGVLAPSMDVQEGDAPPIPGKGNVVTIAQGGDATPLFCIHGGDGGVLFYRSLAALMPPDIPLHAIESLELGNSGPIESCSIEETAAGYIRGVRAIQPHGPYRLVGYSFGGVVAHEMACQLTRDGHAVAFVGFFDTHNPAAPERNYTLTERLRVFWQQNAAVPVQRRLKLVYARLSEGMRTNRRVKAAIQAAQRSGPAEPYSDLRRVQVRQTNWRAMQAYRPQAYQGRITLFKAAAVSDKVERAADYGWAGLAGGGLDIVLVPGEHLTLFAPENIATLAQALTDALRPSDRVAR
jgi:amino acid adenylation domain-containing protein